MSRTCTVCSHERREAIDLEIVSERPFRDIAGRFRLTKSSVERHASEHLPAALARAQTAREVVTAKGLLTYAQFLQARTLAVLDKAEAQGSLGLALSAVRELRGGLELLARLLATVQVSEAQRQQSGALQYLVRDPQFQAVARWLQRELTPAQKATFSALLTDRRETSPSDGPLMD